MDSLLAVQLVYRWAITLAFAGIVVILSITPGIERPGDTIFGWLIVNTATPLQKALHVVVYAALAALWMWTLASVESRVARIALTLVLTVGLGATLEWHQTQVPGRFGTLADVVLNAVGAIAGVLAALLLL